MLGRLTDEDRARLAEFEQQLRDDDTAKAEKPETTKS
jgi:hypothetical protein